MPWPQAGADSKHPGLAGGGPRLAARGGLLMRGYPSCKVFLALGAAAPPPQPELRAVTKAAVTYPLSTQWAGPFRRPSTHQRLICPGCRRRRSRIFNGGDGDISQWANGACVDTWQLPCRGRFSWPLLASAPRVRFSCPLLAPASCVRSSCPLLVSASRVLFLCPLLVPSYRVRPSCLLLVSAFVSASCVRSLLVSTSRVRFLGPLLVSASRVRFSRPLLVPAYRVRPWVRSSCPLIVSACRLRFSCPLLVSASRARSSRPVSASGASFSCPRLVSASRVRFPRPLLVFASCARPSGPRGRRGAQVRGGSGGKSAQGSCRAQRGPGSGIWKFLREADRSTRALGACVGT